MDTSAGARDTIRKVPLLIPRMMGRLLPVDPRALRAGLLGSKGSILGPAAHHYARPMFKRTTQHKLRTTQYASDPASTYPRKDLPMTAPKFGLKTALSASLALVLLVSAVAWQSGRASATTNASEPTPPMADPNTSAPRPLTLAARHAPAQAAAVSPNLSYYFIAGSTFTPWNGFVPFLGNLNGCVQVPLNVPFLAPVHLPQASVVVSMTLYTYDNAITTTIGSAYFIEGDAQGSSGSTLSVSSRPNTNNYQHNQSTDNNPWTIDNKNENFMVEWLKSGAANSQGLSLCGVRVEYYAPLGATWLPVLER